jgi:hypothetical protein
MLRGDGEVEGIRREWRLIVTVVRMSLHHVMRKGKTMVESEGVSGLSSGGSGDGIWRRGGEVLW